MNIEPVFPKQKKFCPDNIRYQPFPVAQINDNGKKFRGYFTGMSIEVFERDDIEQIHMNGCYGIGSQTKMRPRVLYPLPKARILDHIGLNRHKEWNQKFGNHNLSDATVNVLPENESKIIEEGNADDASSDLKVTIEPDPFPVEESLVLFPEEAFFLHYSLKCLAIYDVNHTDEALTTESILKVFFKLNPRFISHFVAYHYLRSKNWVVTRGFKFGGDFLLYYKGPQFHHASYVVVVMDYNTRISNLEMQGLYRVAETVKKSVLILEVTYPTDIDSLNLNSCVENLDLFKVTEMCPKRFHLNSSTQVKEDSTPPTNWREAKASTSAI